MSKIIKRSLAEEIAEKLKEQIEALKQEYKLKIDNIDTAGKTRKDIRQEKRRLRKEQDDKEDELKQKANL